MVKNGGADPFGTKTHHSLTAGKRKKTEPNASQPYNSDLIIEYRVISCPEKMSRNV